MDNDYIPSEDDFKNLKEWVYSFDMSSDEEYSKSLEWSKSIKTLDYNDISFIIDFCIHENWTFYKSNYIPFILKKENKEYIVDLKIFKSKKEYDKFIHNSGYIIHRCFVGENKLTKNNLYGLYYHKDFGKFDWLRGRMQFIIQKICNKKLFNIIYGIEKFKIPKISIKISME